MRRIAYAYARGFVLLHMHVCRRSSEPLEKARRNVRGTSFNCSFLPRAEKNQKSRPKGAEPTVRPLWTPPLPWGWLKGTESPLPKSASGGKTPFGKRTASALILAGMYTVTRAGQANHWTPRPGGLKYVPVGASVVQMVLGMKFSESASPLE